MRKTLGAVAAAVLLTFAVYMVVFGRGHGSTPRQTATTPVAASPSASHTELVATPLPGVTASAIKQAWANHWDEPITENSSQTVLVADHPTGKGDLRLTLTRVPDDPEAVWGLSCVRHGKRAPYRKAVLTELLDFCLPPEVAGEMRTKVVAWLTPMDDSTWRVHRQFPGYTAVVSHVQPPDGVPDSDRKPSLQLSLTGGTYFPA